MIDRYNIGGMLSKWYSYVGQMQVRRRAQQMRGETSNTAIDLCLSPAFYNDTQFLQFYSNFTPWRLVTACI